MHEAGGLLYYDGANLNAILGKVRPGDMGFDVIHMNLHKTFSTPHGGGGPGSGAVGVGKRLLPYMPVPVVGRDGERYRWLDERDLPESIGRLSGFMGNAGVLLRAYVYMRILGAEGMRRVGEFSTLNANYLLARLREAGFDAAYPGRRASHEFIITLQRQARELGVNGDGLCQAAARLRLSCADDVFSVARTGVPADRADRNRDARGTRWFRRSADGDPSRSGDGCGDGQVRAAHAAGAPPRRRARGASNSTWPGSRRALELPARQDDEVRRASCAPLAARWRGFAAAWREEEAFRQECLLALIVIPLGLWLGYERRRARAAGRARCCSC